MQVMDKHTHLLAKRYLIAILLPQDLEQKLRAAYLAAYKTACKVKTLHLTLIPPFTLQSEDKIAQIQMYLSKLPRFRQAFTVDTPNVFVQYKRKILYLPVLPPKPVKTLYDELSHQYQNHMDIDVSKYSNRKVPEFVPHITLAYNFKGDHNILKFPNESFTLPKPELLKEQSPGVWLPHN